MVILQAFGNFWSLIASSGFVVQIVLLILLGFSVLSWAITYRKYSLFREARRQSQAFHSYFRSNSSLSAIHAECEQFPKSPLAGIFKAAYYELQQENRGRPGAFSCGSELERHAAVDASGRPDRDDSAGIIAELAGDDGCGDPFYRPVSEPSSGSLMPFKVWGKARRPPFRQSLPASAKPWLQRLPGSSLPSLP